jgi:hypothetical protein
MYTSMTMGVIGRAFTMTLTQKSRPRPSQAGAKPSTTALARPGIFSKAKAVSGQAKDEALKPSRAGTSLVFTPG